MGYFVKNRQLQSGSSGVRLPTGSAADRPDYPLFGMIRYNTDSGFCEFYNGTIWQTFGTGGTVNYTVDSFTGDGSTVAYTMTVAPADAEQVQVFAGSVYQEPTTAYTVSGTTLTFTSAPPNGVPVNIIQTQN
jgi:succinate dehydrogenase/fumarate reductase flavoprotein subunit